MDLSRYRLERLREDAGLILYRAREPDLGGAVLLLTPAAHTSRLSSLGRIERELELAPELEEAWALHPIALTRHGGNASLLLEDPGGQPLERILGSPMELGAFLTVSIGICEALREVHARGLIHKDIKPANIFVDERGRVRLTGFGIATRVARERQAPTAPEVIAGTFQYMAPEQTGRMNRVIDHRSDLYALGVTLYEMLVGALPFTADTPLDWIHCHVARAPAPPSVRLDGVPPSLEAIILRLLAKNAEDRYQTAAGVEHDLRKFQSIWRIDRAARPFPLGQGDVSRRLIIPQKLYGREDEIEALAAAFDHVATRGKFEVVLVSGASGVGKSAAIREVQRSVHAARGLFAAATLDKQKRDIPYATFAEAFRGLLRNILGKEEAELGRWRADLRQALGASGKLLTDLMPELELILGPLDAPPLLSAKDERNRFHLIFRQFISVFARPDHPLVLVLDDLQWLDAASLDLLERIGSGEATPYLLIICALRTGKGESPSRLSTVLDCIRAARGELKEIRLEALADGDIVQFVADALQLSARKAAPLGNVVAHKTQGNPFFVAQFLETLSREGLLRFNVDDGAWRWDLEAIQAKSFTDNVGELMAERLVRYEPRDLSIITQFACLGLTASVADLARVLQVPESSVDGCLRTFVDDELIHRLEHSYAFVHEGVREAAYAMLSAGKRAVAHLSIGRLLARGLSEKSLEENAFEIANQFNRGKGLVRSRAEQVWLAELNLIAGKRAYAATAYEAALAYFDAGYALLPQDCWAQHYRTSFQLELHRAECQFVLGRIEPAEMALTQLAVRSNGLTDLALVVGRQMILYTYRGRSEKAIELAVACLAQFGVSVPRAPSDTDVEREYQDFARRMAERHVADLFSLPPMTESHWLDVMALLEEVLGPVSTLDANLLDLILLRMANISIDHGRSHEACHAFANLGARVLGWRFGSFEDGHRFGQLAVRMMEELGLDRYASRVYAIVSGVVAPWAQPLRECYDIARKAIDMPRERGGIGYSGYAWVCGLTALLDSGRRLSEMDQLIEAGLANANESKFTLVIEFIVAQQKLVRALQRNDDSPNLTGFDDLDYERYLESSPNLLHAMTRYYVRKLQFLVYARRGDDALLILDKLGGNFDQSPILCQSPVFEVAEYSFFSALARAEYLGDATGAERERHSEALRISAGHLGEWAKRCPENFAPRSALVAAEIARLEARDLDAEQLYERAIRLAGEQGFVQIEALANERAARFYGARGLETITGAYLRNARECFELWGAAAKVRQLEHLHPRLVANVVASDAVEAASRRLQHFDLRALINMYQAVSQEIVLDRLIERLMVTAAEYAGAVRGLLLLPRDGALCIVAEASSHAESVRLIHRTRGAMEAELPVSVLNYVARTQQTVILDDALENAFDSTDPYFRAAPQRSVLCLPLIKQQRLVGALYLENHLASNIFTPDRLSMLQLLASQAAISIENAELFLSAQQAQDRARQVGDELRRAFDSMPTMAWRTDADGTLEIANKQWHDYTGLSQEEARSYLDACHPDDIDKVEERWRHLREFRTSGEVEARLRRFDGEYRSFLVRATPLRDESGAIIKWHGTNTDIENIKRAEQAQEALARVSRVTAMGELTVSIAHEVNQPLMAIVTNAASCLRWLAGDEVNVAEARRAAERIIRDGHRAGEVIASIRALARKAPQQFVEIDLNEVITEALMLARNEFDRHAIVVETRLAPAASAALGDRVQVQQVVLNLIMNGIEAISAEEGGARVLQVRTEAVEGGFVQASVADSGRGLEDGDRERIFDAFFTTKVGGVGMGLSICRSIIESHGGRLFVAPNLPRGCVFSFQVPAFVEERVLVAVE